MTINAVTNARNEGILEDKRGIYSPVVIWSPILVILF